jgi:acetyl-CoA hydrolase
VVVEATEIKEDGSIVPGASVGATPELLQMADKVSWEKKAVFRKTIGS